MFHLLPKVYELARTRTLSLEEAKRIVFNVYFATGLELSAEECWRLRSSFRTRYEPANQVVQERNREWLFVYVDCVKA